MSPAVISFDLEWHCSALILSDAFAMENSVLSHFTRRAMATEFAVLLPAEKSVAAEVALHALECLDSLEAKLSVYRPDSEVSRLNSLAGNQAVKVSADTFTVLEQAKRFWEQTGGAFDVTAGPLVEAWGFTRRRGQKPAPEQIEQALSRVGSRHLRLNLEDQSAELLRPGMVVNLGAIGKGFALDQMAARLLAGGVTDFLIHGGRSSVLAYGDDVPGSGHGWRIAIEHPLLPGRRLGGLCLRNEAVATSGSGKQFFHFRGQRLGHVIDPRSGWPVDELLALTVCHRSAAAADALATGYFVLGWEQVLSCQQARFVGVLPSSAQAEVEVRQHGLTEEQWIEPE